MIRETGSVEAVGVILSCEHARREVPEPWVRLFAGEEAQAALGSHRGWDPGALELARVLRGATGAPLHEGRVSRLVVELNRSIGHRQLWSEWTSGLGGTDRAEILREYYHPYREAVLRDVEHALARGAARVLHLSVHSFTPVWEGRRREVDLGILFDLSRAGESAFARAWAAELTKILPGYAVRFNEPYLGTDDGLTTALRGLFDAERYLGIEFELNQRFVTELDEAARGALYGAIAQAFTRSCGCLA